MTQLSQEEQCREHNRASAPTGKYGMQSLEERTSLEAKFTSNANKAPRLALRELKLEPAAPSRRDGLRKIQLKAAQKVKRMVSKKKFCASKVGQLERMVAPHKSFPSDHFKGFFCTAEITRNAQGKPKITLVATTRMLMNRLADASDHTCVVCADGGHKFTLLGWPVSVIGVINGRGNFGLVALTLTSTVSDEHIAEALRSLKDALGSVAF